MDESGVNLICVGVGEPDSGYEALSVERDCSQLDKTRLDCLTDCCTEASSLMRLHKLQCMIRSCGHLALEIALGWGLFSPCACAGTPESANKFGDSLGFPKANLYCDPDMNIYRDIEGLRSGALATFASPATIKVRIQTLRACCSGASQAADAAVLAEHLQAGRGAAAGSYQEVRPADAAANASLPSD